MEQYYNQLLIDWIVAILRSSVVMAGKLDSKRNKRGTLRFIFTNRI